MPSYRVFDDTKACVSPPAAQAAKYNSYLTEEFGAGAAVATTSVKPPPERPRTSIKNADMRDHPINAEVTSSVSGNRSRRHSSSAGSYQHGLEAVTIPITAGIRPQSSQHFSSPVPPLITKDTFSGALPKLPTSSNTSVTSGLNASSGGGDSDAEQTAKNAPSALSSRPSSRQRPPVVSPSPVPPFSYNNGALYPTQSDMYAAAAAAAPPGRLPAMQPTLRGAATSGHPAAARNTTQHPTAQRGVQGTGSYSSAGGAAYPNGPQVGVPHPENSWGAAGTGYNNATALGMNGGRGMPNMPYNPYVQGYLSPNPMSLCGNGGAFNGGANNGATMNMMYGVPQTFMGGFNGTPPLPSSSPYPPGGMVGYAMPDGTAPMYYGNNGGVRRSSNGTNASNSNSSGSNGVRPFNTSPPNAFYPYMPMQGQPGPYQLEVNAYGSMRSGPGGINNNAGPMMGGLPSYPQNYSGSSAGQQNGPTTQTTMQDATRGASQRGLHTAATAPSFPSPKKNLNSTHRQQSAASLVSQSYRGNDTDGDLFMQSVNTEALSIPEMRPASKKAKRPAAGRPQKNTQRSTEWFSAPPSQTNRAAVFSSEENVLHEGRTASWQGHTSSPDIPQLPSQRSTSMFVTQRRVSESDPKNSRSVSVTSASRPGLLRRFADQCGRIGRGATSGLRRRSATEKRRRRRKAGDEEGNDAASPSSSSQGTSSRDSFMDELDGNSENEEEDDRSFDDSDDLSEEDKGKWQPGYRSTSKHAGAAGRARAGSTSTAVTIAQRRRIRVKSLDISVINLAVSERK